ncbi:MAG: ROK family protein [Gemmobacter sp.]|nr:ROK family protein [Gemmobacter sp.]
MLDRPATRSRKETRAAVMEGLLRSKGAFRQAIAHDSRLTEASVSRILTELRSAGLIDESRIPAPYFGGPTALVSLRKDICVAGIELSNGRLSFGVGDLGCALDYVERMPVPARLAQADFERMARVSFAEMIAWADQRGRVIRQIALSLPGFSQSDTNPIFPWDMTRLRDFLADLVKPYPLALTNSVIAQAAFHRYCASDVYPVSGDHLFLFVAHGVAGVVVHESAPIETFNPFELGHMVIERGGALCRCGHRGCLEAYTSLQAISPVIGLPAGDILRGGDQFVATAQQTPEQRATLRDRLFLLGMGIGNALNLQPLPAVVISGWPSLIPEADRCAILDGLNETLLGGYRADRLPLHFIAPSIGNDPRAAMAYAAYSFVSTGGQDAAPRLSEIA